MLAGTTPAPGLGRWIALTAVVTLILVIKAWAEERPTLAARFAPEYDEDARQVPMLIPGRRWRRAGGSTNDSGR